MDIFMSIIGYMGAVGIAIFSLPELIRSLRSRRTSGINVWLFLLLMVSSACFFISGFYNFAQNLARDGWTSANQFALAVAVANIFSFLVPSTLLSYKLFHILMAKKQGITEKEYEDKINSNRK
ncbi:hypothetical protein D8X55_01670 [Malacoplasma penetrans]|uniref:Uncharacterized protein n=1 Tax=Malacoplasma penetrans (strain HF-2) TaxID=272633 RepID=Q8EWN9_MALP2|nr:PQ-loop domain-containing transporter [Malacoplasma penetrans]RXY96982.1 hypothetical protein D8X55_01670 [Malacoplasma penetrans]BAC43955.1 conserved hypothetical protein [Malacoplasma penetrans HF-2]